MGKKIGGIMSGNMPVAKTAGGSGKMGKGMKGGKATAKGGKKGY